MKESDSFGISISGLTGRNERFQKRLENWASSFETSAEYVDITKKVLSQLYSDIKIPNDDGTERFDDTIPDGEKYLKALSIISSQLFKLNQR